MGKFDPQVLRQLATNYRARADWEPRKAHIFRVIAANMEMDAHRIESGGSQSTP